MGKQPKYKLFNESGCLTAEAVAMLIDGELSRAELYQVNRHIAECDLCANAIRGGNMFDNGNTYIQSVNSVKQAWTQRHEQRPVRSFPYAAITIGIAASLLILGGIFWIIRQQQYQKALYAKHFSQAGEDIDAYMEEASIIPYSTKRIVQDHEKIIREDFFKRSETYPELTQPVAELEGARILANQDNHLSRVEETDIRTHEETYLPYPYIITHMPPVLENDQKKLDQRKITLGITEMPKFRGDNGTALFTGYVQQKLKYPSYALNNNVSGKVLVQFTVNKEGIVINPKVLSSTHEIFENEVVRVITGSPLWEPGKSGDKPIEISMVMPVYFEIH